MCDNSYFQLEALKHYLDGGGNVLVMLGEGGELKYDTNINFLLEEYGIMVNSGAAHHFTHFKSLVCFHHVNVKPPLFLILLPILLCYAADAVVRNVYYKYFHPKEALVSNGVLNRFVWVSLMQSVIFIICTSLHIAHSFPLRSLETNNCAKILMYISFSILSCHLFVHCTILIFLV